MPELPSHAQNASRRWERASNGLIASLVWRGRPRPLPRDPAPSDAPPVPPGRLRPRHDEGCAPA